MSSHHSQRAIQLHHQQVNEAKQRREQRHAERYSRYLTMRHDARLNYNFVMCVAFVWFAYLNIATAVYLGYIL